VLAHARAGIYREETLERIDNGRRRRWFLRGRGAHEGLVRVKPGLQESIEFREFNLIKPWQMPEPFDIVFCRNVVIYFDKPTQRELFARIADAMHPGGYLYLGHSETLFEISDRFELVGKTVYRKP
jgi:chemotaxis protein methyltransferase CheR